MKPFLKTSLLSACFSMAVSCALAPTNLGPAALADSIEKNAAALNDAHTRSMISIISTNILRARDRMPTNYTTVSGIKSNPTVEVNGSLKLAPLGLGNAVGPFTGSETSVSRNETANAEYSVNPFATNEKTKGLYEPMDESVLKSYLDAGWPKDTILYLFVDSVTLDSDPSTRLAIDGDKDINPEVFKLVTRVKDGEIVFQRVSTKLEDRKCQIFNPAPTIAALGIKEAPPLDILNMIERLTELKIILSVSPEKEDRSQPVFEGQIRLCDPEKTMWKFMEVMTDKDGKTIEAPFATARIRSFDDMIYFLGESIRGDGKIGGTLLFDVEDAASNPRKPNVSYAASLDHQGRQYLVPVSDTTESIDVQESNRTGTVLSLLNQLYLRSQSNEFLRAPNGVVRLN